MITLKKKTEKEARSKKHQIEDSIALRVVTTGMAVTGIAAVAYLAESSVILLCLSVFGTVLGSWLSYKRRYKSNLVAKIWISVGILIIAAIFFRELLTRLNASIADARAPLTEMLMALMALHSFDLPRRRDLSLSALVGLVLITSASTLSRDLSFLAFVAVFVVMALLMFQFDCASRTKSKFLHESRAEAEGANDSTTEHSNDKAYTDLTDKPAPKSRSAKKELLVQVATLSLLMLACTTLCLSVLPRVQISSFNQLRLGSGLNLPFIGQVNLPNMQLGKLMSPDGSIKSQPNAYFGFAESLDTNYRGRLEERIVLRVSGTMGSYLRGMAYDKFDGKCWTMNRPKETRDLLASSGNSFDMPLKNQLHSRLKYRDLSQIVYVEEDSSNLVVCSTIPLRIFFPSEKLQIDTYGAIRSPVGMQKDMVYTVFSKMPIYDFKKLRLDEELSEEEELRFHERFQEYLQLPSMEDGVTKLAAKVAGKGTRYRRAENICNYLLSHFKYDLDLAPTPEGRDTVSDFLLHKKRGYCEHFASALVLMARSQDIPARLVTGYCPGQFNPFTGLWEVRLSDAHSWAEVYIPNWGWIPLDATPGGMGAAFQVENPRSVFSYLESQLSSALVNFSKSPEGQQLNRLANDFLSMVGHTFLSLSTVLPQLCVLGLLLAVVASAIFLQNKNFSRRFLQSFQNLLSRKGREEGLPLQFEASRQYMLVVKALESLDIVRTPADTASDILKKAQAKLESGSQPEQDFFQNCINFLDLYSEVRFGAIDELPRLQTLSQNVLNQAEILSNQRKSASIS